MAILVGIDEAGYGPILGPLTVSSVAIQLPDSHLKSDMWQTLIKTVSKQKKNLAGRLLIADSKKAFTRSSGPIHLSRAVLASLSILNTAPTDAFQLLQSLCPDCVVRLADYPWHKDLHKIPLHASPDDIKVASSALKKTMAENNMHLLSLQSRCLDVERYNHLVGNVKNKSTVLFTAICQLIQNIFTDAHPDQNLQIIVDRQGGRIAYAPPLLKMFPEMSLAIIKQDEKLSSYEMTDGKKTMRLHFTTKADDRFLPVALASMTSKYIRELMMDSINRYFIEQCPDLKPTAGYWTDGKRFISDLQKNLPNTTIPTNLLVRCK